jgi:hypothetical protein
MAVPYTPGGLFTRNLDVKGKSFVHGNDFPKETVDRGVHVRQMWARIGKSVFKKQAHEHLQKD